MQLNEPKGMIREEINVCAFIEKRLTKPTETTKRQKRDSESFCISFSLAATILFRVHVVPWARCIKGITLELIPASILLVSRVPAVRPAALSAPGTSAEMTTVAETRASATVWVPSVLHPSTSPTKQYATRNSYVTWE